MYEAQKVTNYIRISVPDGTPGTREDIDGAFDVFRGSISCAHAGTTAMTVIFTDHSALFMHKRESGDMEIQIVAPDDVIAFLQDAILSGDTGEKEAAELMSLGAGAREAREKIAEYLHGALMKANHATA